ncbi:MAG TPA: LacI family DNA-binding transcriptional regulator [Ohtaekwangia sp.]|nr:LacI family DNA-binding transcriptional regulator [Ohtaekwangia sp.]
MGSRNEVTIYDIAKVLNLSASTISRALNGSELVTKQTRSKVEQVANELGYQKNALASRLRSQKSFLLGAMVTQFNTTIASSVLSGAETTARQLGHSIIVHQSMNNPELRASNLENFRNQSVDGILVTSAYFQEYPSLDQFTALDVPVLVIEASSMLPSLPRKQASDFQNAYELTNHLIEKGCRKIAYMSVDLDKTRHANLLSGYHKALQHNRLSDADKFVLNTHDVQNSWADIAEILGSLLPMPDGIIFSTEEVTALAFTSSNTSNAKRNEFWVTCRKGKENQVLVELGKFAGALLISLSRRDNITPTNMN